MWGSALFLVEPSRPRSTVIHRVTVNGFIIVTVVTDGLLAVVGALVCRQSADGHAFVVTSMAVRYLIGV